MDDAELKGLAQNLMDLLRRINAGELEASQDARLRMEGALIVVKLMSRRPGKLDIEEFSNSLY